jgi:hypothetical protein
MDQTIVGIYWANEGTLVLGAAAAAVKPDRRPSRRTEGDERRNPDKSPYNTVPRMSKWRSHPRKLTRAALRQRGPHISTPVSR